MSFPGGSYPDTRIEHVEAPPDTVRDFTLDGWVFDLEQPGTDALGRIAWQHLEEPEP